MKKFFIKIVRKVKEFFLTTCKVFIEKSGKWFANLKSSECRFFLYDTETIHSTKKTPYKKQYNAIKDIVELSYVILKKNGKKVYKTEKSFIVEEFWNDKKYLRSKNYMQYRNKQGNLEWHEVQNFAINKIPKWNKAIKEGTSKVAKWQDILTEIAQDLEYYDINLIAAYNIVFDRQAIVSTSQIINDRYYKCKTDYFYIGNFWQIPFIDIYYVIEKIVTSPEFIEWANAHREFVYNSHGNIRLTAQVLYQFCVRFKNELMSIIELDSINWSESHIAVEDIECEAAILEYVITEFEGDELLVEIDKYGNALRANKKIKEVSLNQSLQQLKLFE